MSRAFLLLLAGGAAYAHVVSMSTGELRVTGRTAAYELRIPMYEIAHVSNPKTALLDQVKFEGARRTSSNCQEQNGDYVCRADYEFDSPVPNKVEVDCTLFQVTVPNHIHMLYAVQGPNSDQLVFDQNVQQSEIRFHPPSRAEVVAKDSAAGVGMLMKSVSGLLFLCVLALAARNMREAGILTIALLAGEWLARVLSPHIPMAFGPPFLEAVQALTAAYLAAEIVFLPESQARWAMVPILGVIHGLPFAAFPASYLAAACVAQGLLLAGLWFGASKMPDGWRRPSASALLIAGLAWFARQLFP